MLHSFIKARHKDQKLFKSEIIMQAKDEYKHTASIYDILFSRGLRSIRNNIRTFFNHSEATSIIDICCGTGEQLRILDEKVLLLTGVDLSPAMLAKAREKSPSSIHYLETDATKIPLADDTYDGVIISFALHEKSSSQQRAIFKEACRLVSHSGFIVIADYATPPPLYSSFVVGNILIATIERMAGLNHYHNYREWMRQGAIEGFLQKNSPGKLTLIAPHSKGCINVFAVSECKANPFSESLKRSATAVK